MSKTDGGNAVTVTFDTERHQVTIGDQTFPTRPLNQATLKRFAAQYNGRPVPIANLLEPFAGEDEKAETWTITRLGAISKQLIGQELQLVWEKAHGVNGGGRKVGFRFASADDPEAQDQLVDAMLRAQAARARATERHTRLVDAAKKCGIVVPE
jgi:hypothetical protein